MEDLIEELLAIMDEECEENEEWQKNKPTIINIYIGGEEWCIKILICRVLIHKQILTG